MNDMTLLGPWVRRFLLEHLVAERNLARNTQRSYRDALILLIPFVAGKLHKSLDRLTVIDLSADLLRLFLSDLEQSRQCVITTRNQRLAAIHALARFVGEHSPEHIAWCVQIRSIPLKKGRQNRHSVSRQTGDGCAPGRPRPANRPGPTRPRLVTLSL
jgi:integrase/recombinase XerD